MISKLKLKILLLLLTLNFISICNYFSFTFLCSKKNVSFVNKQKLELYSLADSFKLSLEENPTKIFSCRLNSAQTDAWLLLTVGMHIFSIFVGALRKTPTTGS